MYLTLIPVIGAAGVMRWLGSKILAGVDKGINVKIVKKIFLFLPSIYLKKN
jgi:hypothetical protein